MKKYSLLFAGFVMAGFALVAAAPAYALTVSPVLYDFEVDPGEKRYGTISLMNDSGGAGTFTLDVQNFVALGEDGAQGYLDEEVPSGLASWVTVDRPTLFMDAGDRGEFPFIISVPADAEPGGHYATVFFSQVPDEHGGAVGIGEAIGVLLLVNVMGEVHEEARIETFTVRGDSLHSRLPIYFDTRIRNYGNTHFRPRGELVVRNVFGDVVARELVNPKNSAVLPNSVRRIESVWRKDVNDELRGNFIEELRLEWENFALGPYTASVQIEYGSHAWQLASAEVRFWVLPWRVLLAGVGGVLFLVLLFTLYHKLVVSRAVARARRKE